MPLPACLPACLPAGYPLPEGDLSDFARWLRTGGGERQVPRRLLHHLTNNKSTKGIKMSWDAPSGAVCGHDNAKAKHLHPGKGEDRGLTLAGATDGGGGRAVGLAAMVVAGAQRTASISIQAHLPCT